MGLTQITTGGVDDNINIDSNTLKVDGTNNRVGIGTSSPSRILQIKAPSANTAHIALIDNDSSNEIWQVGNQSDGDGFMALRTDEGTTSVLFDASGTNYINGGNVGIGTTSPVSILHVEESAGAAYIRSRSAQNSVHFFAGASNGGVDLGSESNHVVRFYQNNGEKMRIDSSGDLCFGSTVGANNDGSGISIYNASFPRLSFRNSTTGNTTSDGSQLYLVNSDLYVTNNESANLIFRTNSTERSRIDSSGRLMLGTTSVANASLLTVQGNSSNASGGASIYIQRGSANPNGTLGSINFADSNESRGASIFAATDGTWGTNDYPGRLVFTTTADGASSPTERMRIDNSGQVGIGTSSPGALLNLEATNSASLRIKNTQNNTPSVPHIELLNNNNEGLDIKIDRSGIGSRARFIADAEISFEQGSSERMRIDSNGNFGIGTTSPTNYTDHVSLVLAGKAGQGAGRLDFNDTSGNKDASIFADNGRLFLDADPDSATASSSIQLRVDGGTTRVRIDSNGAFRTLGTNTSALAVRNTAAAGTSVSNFVGLHTATNNDNGTVSIRIYTNGNIQNTNNSYGSLSDEKLKENIVDSGSQWDDIKDIRVRKYNFKASTNYETFTQLGVIAQEVETVSPGLVSEVPDTDDEGNDLGTTTKAVNYSVLYMKAVKALQEAMDRIETLEAKVAALEAAE